jgi:uncharacterized membrane protein YphA (DoxX/SURF4 family)
LSLFALIIPVRGGSALSAKQRYYPGFFGALFLVALRMCIGWHFFHEAHHKIESQESDRPFSAEAYLRNATGPLATKFRELIPDVDSLQRLNYDHVRADWESELSRITKEYAFEADQSEKATKALEERLAEAKVWFEDPETTTKLTQYREDLEIVQNAGEGGPAIAFEMERITKLRSDLEGQRRALLAPIDEWTKGLRATWTGLARPDQIEIAGTYEPPSGEMAQLNALVMYGMLACGLCLMLGLLTPLAALGAAGYLAMFYLSMPPWPGLPPNPQAEGNYLYVNKNLIEMFACLFIAATPSGRWIGLDSLVFGWIGRRSAQPADAEPAVANT